MSPFDWEIEVWRIQLGWTDNWRGLRMGAGWRNIGALWFRWRTP